MRFRSRVADPARAEYTPEMRLAGLEVEVMGSAGAPPVVFLHGIGLGPWLWEPWLAPFVERGFRTVALTLPGHGPEAGNPRFSDLVDAVIAVLDAIGGEPTLVGHSMGGLVAQVVAERRAVASLVLVCPLPPGQVRVVPPLRALRHGLAFARAFAKRAPVRVPWPMYREVGLDVMDEPTARACYARTLPWPHALTRDLAFHRPEIDYDKIRAPVLVCIGGRDRLVPWQAARTLGDLFEAVTWRYDDLGHMPPWEPGGERMGRDIAAWVSAPTAPQVIESEGFGPAEGVGHEVRHARRGEQMKRRSAYGQKRSARS